MSAKLHWWRKWFYCGKVIMTCDCHGYNAGWAFKIHRIVSFSTRLHGGRRDLIVDIGEKAAIYYAGVDEWNRADEKCRNKKKEAA